MERKRAKELGIQKGGKMRKYNTKLNFCREKHIERLHEHYDKELEAKDK